MIQLPSKYKEYTISLVVSVISALILLGVQSSISQNPSVNVTVLEWLNSTSNHARLETLIQNVGNAPAEKITILFAVPTGYNLTDYSSTDGIPLKSDFINHNLVISMERLAPHSFTILEVEGNVGYNSAKTVWLAFNKGTTQLVLPTSKTSIGITSIDDVVQVSLIFSFTGIMLTVSAVIRYYSVNRTEAFRLRYLNYSLIR